MHHINYIAINHFMFQPAIFNDSKPILKFFNEFTLLIPFFIIGPAKPHEEESCIIKMFTIQNNSKVKSSFKILGCKFCKIANKFFGVLFATLNQFPVVNLYDSSHDPPNGMSLLKTLQTLLSIVLTRHQILDTRSVNSGSSSRSF